MEQEEPVWAAVAMPGVEVPDGIGRGSENLVVERQPFRVRVPERPLVEAWRALVEAACERGA